MKRAKGMTMIESMVYIVITATITVFAVPSFVSMLDNNRTASVAQVMNQHFEYARSEAIKRNQAVEICARVPGTSDCGTGGSWTSGWLIHTTNSLGQRVVLKAQPALAASSLVDLTMSSLQFRSNGLLASGQTNILVSGAHCSSNGARQITLTKVGFATTQKVSC